MRRIVLLVEVALVLAAMLALSALSASAFPGRAAGKGIDKACEKATIVNNPFFTCAP